MYEETCIESKLVFDGIVMKLYDDTVNLPDGSISHSKIARHPGGSAILYVQDGCVLLEKQYRYAIGKTIYEIPAGKIDKNEPPIQTAIREFSEETGYVANSIEPILSLYPSPGYLSEMLYLFHVTSATPAEKHPDEGEFLDLEFIPVKKAMQMIAAGEICDAKTVIAMQYYCLKYGILI